MVRRASIFSRPGTLLLCILCSSAPAATFADSRALEPADSVRLGDEASEAAHGVRFQGARARGRFGMSIGRVRIAADGLALGDPPGRVEFTLQGRTPSARRTLLIRELHLDVDPIGERSADPRDPVVSPAAEGRGGESWWIPLDGPGPWFQGIPPATAASAYQNVLVRVRKTGMKEARFRGVRLRCRILDDAGAVLGEASRSAAEIAGDDGWVRLPFPSDVPAARAVRMEWTVPGPAPDAVNYFQLEARKDALPGSGRLEGPGVLPVHSTLRYALGPRHRTAYRVRTATADGGWLDVADRDFHDRGAGPHLHLVDLPAGDPGGSAAVTVAIENRAAGSSARLVLADVRLYENLDDGLAALDAPLHVALISGLAHFSGREADLRWAVESFPERRKKGLGGNAVLRAFGVEVPYASWTDAYLEPALRKVVDWTVAGKIPLALYLSGWWSGTPGAVPDGEEGKFGDPKYQQIVFSETDTIPDTAPLGGIYAEDVRFGLPVPNGWANAKWLSLNNPRLNAHRTRRLEEVSRLIHAMAPPNLLLVGTDNEPWYWGRQMTEMDRFEEANGGRPRLYGIGDVGPDAVAAAARDGVRLDPRDGMSPAEWSWLHRNLNDYHALMAGAIRRILPPEIPVFTQSMTTPGYPLDDPCRPVMEAGVVGDGVHAGLESVIWLPDPPARWPMWAADDRGSIDRLTGFESRLADLNFETTMTTPTQLERALRVAYEKGLTYVGLYNTTDRDAWPKRRDAIEKFGKGLDEAAVRERRRALFLLKLNEAN